MGRLAFAITCVWLVCPAFAHAQDAAPVAPATVALEAPDLARARELYKAGLTAVENAQWAEALAAFEGSHALRPHPLTLYNIGACERALGRYAKALGTLQTAIELGQVDGGQLTPAVLEEARGYIAELTRLLAHLHLTIWPRDATLTIDGRPLAAASENGKRVFVAGRKPPGLGEVLPEARADVVLDPGAHVFTVSRRGFADRVINKTFTPGSHQKLVLNLDKLPGSLRIASDRDNAVVRVNALDVGVAPVEVTRPAGYYRISVAKPGFVTYETAVSLRPGEQAAIRAPLKPEGAQLHKKWWFWTAAGAVIAGAAVGTYYATRDDPQQVRPPLETGGLGWNVKVD